MEKAEVWFERGIRAATVEQIFTENLNLLTDLVEPSERWNLYYTVADCLEESGRKLKEQHHIPFDVDKIDIPFLNGKVDTDKLNVIARVVCDAIGVPFEKCGVLFSGGGIQVIVGTKHVIKDENYFDHARHHYKAIADRIDLRLMQAGIKGAADRSVWSPARLMRFPITENRKAGRDNIMGILLNETIERLDFDLKHASGLPDVPANQQVSQKVVDSFPAPDVKAIMDPAKGCKFLHWCQTMPEKVSEPEWYAMVSVTARFPEGRKFTHKMSEGHPGYNYDETETKITQAIEASGPRTCKNIDAISGGKCKGCVHHGDTKLVTPLLIVGPDHIKTANTGFHNVFVTPEGNVKKGKPNYEDLQKAFSKDHDYISVKTTSMLWQFNGKHFEELHKDDVHLYAYNKFDPKPVEAIRKEFFSVVRLKNMVDKDFLSNSIEGKMNFQNTVFDVKSQTQHPHSKEYGFRQTLPCDYDPRATAPRFLQFMNDITLGRQNLINIIQEFMGYTFANGACKYGKVLVMLGDGSNGKSTLVNVMRLLATKHGFSSLSVKDMMKDQNRYSMEGKLVNIAEENSKDSFRDTELIKNFATGGYINVKRLYEQPYDYENKTKLIMLCNKLPNTVDATHGFFRRLLLVPFDATFDEKTADINILEKLKAELPGIFNWVMEGYRRLEEQGHFTADETVEHMLNEYKKDSDPTLAFIHDALEISRDDDIGTVRQEIYSEFKSWCEMNGVRHHSDARGFYPLLRKYLSKSFKLTDLDYRNQGQPGRPWFMKHIRLAQRQNK